MPSKTCTSEALPRGTSKTPSFPFAAGLAFAALAVGSLGARAQGTMTQADACALTGTCAAGASASTAGGVGAGGTGAGGGASLSAMPSAAAGTDAKSTAPLTIHSDDTQAERARSAAGDLRPQTAPRVPVRASDFEVFVRDTVGYALPVFGRDLFVSSDAVFSQPNAAAPADYTVGPGDELRIRSTGKVDLDVRTRVDAGGQIYIPQVGPVPVAGTRVDQLTEVVRKSVARQFRGFDLTVTMGQLRPMQIFVLGQAVRPGSYTVSPLSTLVNALFASGGPSAAGSLRDVQLIRGNETIAHFDVYRLLLAGDKSQDHTLLPGDILYLPPVGPQVAVAGDVRNPAIYELKGPTTVDTVLQDAAGLSPVAGTARATLDRVESHDRRSLLNFALDAQGRATVLAAGDILRVLPVSARIEGAVTLRGPVAVPGRYAWHPGMRVHDLLPTRTALLTRAYFNRKNALDLPQSPAAAAAENAQQESTAAAAGRGGVAKSAAAAADGFKPAVAASEGDERTNAAATMQHDTDVDWRYATIERVSPEDLKVHLIPFDLGMAIDQPESAENKTLLDGDVVSLYSSRDLHLPLELTTKFVRIDGEVVAPGVYQVSGADTLRDLVRRAGGLAPHAYLYAAQFTRESVRASQEENLQRLIRRERMEALSPSNVVTSSNAVGGTAGAGADLELRKAYLQELANLHATGRVVLAMKPGDHSVDDVPALLLQDADHLFVPAVPNTVSVLGSVYNPGALQYLDETRVKTYLNSAGGPEREADRSREFILRADGSLIGRGNVHNFDRQILYPGDTVMVPTNFKGRRAPLNFLELTTALGSLALTAVAVKALN